MASPLLYWENLQRTNLLAPSSASVYSGDCVVLQGASGSGKSLLWRALAGIDQCSFSALGYQDQDYTSCQPSHWRQMILYTSQQASFSQGHVEDALREPFTYRANSHLDYDRSQVVHWLEQLGKSDKLLNQPISELSGGERHIIHVLRALQLNPKVVLLDEPTAALDTSSTEQFEALMQQWLHTQSDRALLWISHDANQCTRIATRQWLMQQQHLITEP
ncbi:ATP-binding cassette domain-containing protein [Suttonella sp. R2A3]|uniref:ABC transporter ATP-binding protein n=1 Tax=Suttonella sp. R2A3 TaxID=2908648 RepID=UPI001F1EC2C3|nr:ATP-binding cassette domain-containing protein [Suttonella sp. R2A3]UJF24587.1 ATP-binding cassette domain-containing protein [Suttonella sp. R2A3]